MATPLKIKDASGNIQQFTTAEENYLAYQIGLQLADAGTDSAGAIRTGSGTSIGSFTNTFFNQSVGTHPSTAITTGTTTYTLYQNQDSTNVAETDSDWHRPLMWVDSASQTGFKEMPEADLNSAVDRYLQTIFTNDYPGTFKLASTSPGPDYSVHLSSVFTDTRTDGTSTAYNIYKRTAYTAPSTVRPLYVRDNGGFDGIQAMTDRQIKFSFGQRAKRRIAKSKIGTYQFRSSGQGAPTDPGTWVPVGTATDTKQTTSDQTYTRDSTLNFVGNYTQNYTGAYSTNYTRLYSIDYTYPYDTTYTTPYAISYSKGTVESFSSLFTTLAGYTNQYSTVFTNNQQETLYASVQYLTTLFTPTGERSFAPTYQSQGYLGNRFFASASYEGLKVATYERDEYSGNQYSNTTNIASYATYTQQFYSADTDTVYLHSLDYQQFYQQSSYVAEVDPKFRYGGNPTNAVFSSERFTQFYLGTTITSYASYTTNRYTDAFAVNTYLGPTLYTNYTADNYYTGLTTNYDNQVYATYETSYQNTTYTSIVDFVTYIGGDPLLYTPDNFVTYVAGVDVTPVSYVSESNDYLQLQYTPDLPSYESSTPYASAFRPEDAYQGPMYTGPNPTSYGGAASFYQTYNSALYETISIFPADYLSTYVGEAFYELNYYTSTYLLGDLQTYSSNSPYFYENFTSGDYETSYTSQQLFYNLPTYLGSAEVNYIGAQTSSFYAQTYAVYEGSVGSYVNVIGYSGSTSTYATLGYAGLVGYSTYSSIVYYSTDETTGRYVQGDEYAPVDVSYIQNYLRGPTVDYTGPKSYDSVLIGTGYTNSRFLPTSFYDLLTYLRTTAYYTGSYVADEYYSSEITVQYDNAANYTTGYTGNYGDQSYTGPDLTLNYVGPGTETYAPSTYTGNIASYGVSGYISETGFESYVSAPVYQNSYVVTYAANFAAISYQSGAYGNAFTNTFYQNPYLNVPYTGSYSAVGGLTYTNQDIQYYVPSYVPGGDELLYTEPYTGTYTQIYTPNYTNQYTSSYTTSLFYDSQTQYDINYSITVGYELSLYSSNPITATYSTSFMPPEEQTTLGYVGPGIFYTRKQDDLTPIPIYQNTTDTAGYTLGASTYESAIYTRDTVYEGTVFGDPTDPLYLVYTGSYNKAETYTDFRNDDLNRDLEFYQANNKSFYVSPGYVGPINALFGATYAAVGGTYGGGYYGSILGDQVIDYVRGINYLGNTFVGRYENYITQIGMSYLNNDYQRYVSANSYTREVNYLSTQSYLTYLLTTNYTRSINYAGGPSFASTLYQRTLYYQGGNVDAFYTGPAPYTSPTPFVGATSYDSYLDRKQLYTPNIDNRYYNTYLTVSGIYEGNIYVPNDINLYDPSRIFNFPFTQAYLGPADATIYYNGYQQNDPYQTALDAGGNSQQLYVGPVGFNVPFGGGNPEPYGQLIVSENYTSTRSYVKDTGEDILIYLGGALSNYASYLNNLYETVYTGTLPRNYTGPAYYTSDNVSIYAQFMPTQPLLAYMGPGYDTNTTAYEKSLFYLATSGQYEREINYLKNYSSVNVNQNMYIGIGNVPNIMFREIDVYTGDTSFYLSPDYESGYSRFNLLSYSKGGYGAIYYTGVSSEIQGYGSHLRIGTVNPAYTPLAEDGLQQARDNMNYVGPIFAAYQSEQTTEQQFASGTFAGTKVGQDSYYNVTGNYLGATYLGPTGDYVGTTGLYYTGATNYVRTYTQLDYTSEYIGDAYNIYLGYISGYIPNEDYQSFYTGTVSATINPANPDANYLATIDTNYVRETMGYLGSDYSAPLTLTQTYGGGTYSAFAQFMGDAAYISLGRYDAQPYTGLPAYRFAYYGASRSYTGFYTAYQGQRGFAGTQVAYLGQSSLNVRYDGPIHIREYIGDIYYTGFTAYSALYETDYTSPIGYSPQTSYTGPFYNPDVIYTDPGNANYIGYIRNENYTGDSLSSYIPNYTGENPLAYYTPNYVGGYEGGYTGGDPILVFRTYDGTGTSQYAKSYDSRGYVGPTIGYVSTSGYGGPPITTYYTGSTSYTTNVFDLSGITEYMGINDPAYTHTSGVYGDGRISFVPETSYTVGFFAGVTTIYFANDQLFARTGEAADVYSNGGLAELATYYAGGGYIPGPDGYTSFRNYGGFLGIHTDPAQVQLGSGQYESLIFNAAYSTSRYVNTNTEQGYISEYIQSSTEYVGQYTLSGTTNFNIGFDLSYTGPIYQPLPVYTNRYTLTDDYGNRDAAIYLDLNYVGDTVNFYTGEYSNVGNLYSVNYENQFYNVRVANYLREGTIYNEEVYVGKIYTGYKLYTGLNTVAYLGPTTYDTFEVTAYQSDIFYVRGSTYYLGPGLQYYLGVSQYASIVPDSLSYLGPLQYTRELYFQPSQYYTSLSQPGYYLREYFVENFLKNETYIGERYTGNYTGGIYATTGAVDYGQAAYIGPNLQTSLYATYGSVNTTQTQSYVPDGYGLVLYSPPGLEYVTDYTGGNVYTAYAQYAIISYQPVYTGPLYDNIYTENYSLVYTGLNLASSYDPPLVYTAASGDNYVPDGASYVGGPYVQDYIVGYTTTYSSNYGLEGYTGPLSRYSSVFENSYVPIRTYTGGYENTSGLGTDYTTINSYVVGGVFSAIYTAEAAQTIPYAGFDGSTGVSQTSIYVSGDRPTYTSFSNQGFFRTSLRYTAMYSDQYTLDQYNSAVVYSGPTYTLGRDTYASYNNFVGSYQGGQPVNYTIDYASYATIYLGTINIYETGAYTGVSNTVGNYIAQYIGQSNAYETIGPSYGGSIYTHTPYGSYQDPINAFGGYSNTFYVKSLFYSGGYIVGGAGAYDAAENYASYSSGNQAYQREATSFRTFDTIYALYTKGYNANAPLYYSDLNINTIYVQGYDNTIPTQNNYLGPGNYASGSANYTRSQYGKYYTTAGESPYILTFYTGPNTQYVGETQYLGLAGIYYSNNSGLNSYTGTGTYTGTDGRYTTNYDPRSSYETYGAQKFEGQVRSTNYTTAYLTYNKEYIGVQKFYVTKGTNYIANYYLGSGAYVGPTGTYQGNQRYYGKGTYDGLTSYYIGPLEATYFVNPYDGITSYTTGTGAFVGGTTLYTNEDLLGPMFYEGGDQYLIYINNVYTSPSIYQEYIIGEVPLQKYVDAFNTALVYLGPAFKFATFTSGIRYENEVFSTTYQADATTYFVGFESTYTNQRVYGAPDGIGNYQQNSYDETQFSGYTAPTYLGPTSYYTGASPHDGLVTGYTGSGSYGSFPYVNSITLYELQYNASQPDIFVNDYVARYNNFMPEVYTGPRSIFYGVNYSSANTFYDQNTILSFTDENVKSSEERVFGSYSAFYTAGGTYVVGYTDQSYTSAISYNSLQGGLYVGGSYANNVYAGYGSTTQTSFISQKAIGYTLNYSGDTSYVVNHYTAGKLYGTNVAYAGPESFTTVDGNVYTSLQGTITYVPLYSKARIYTSDQIYLQGPGVYLNENYESGGTVTTTGYISGRYLGDKDYNGYGAYINAGYYNGYGTGAPVYEGPITYTGAVYAGPLGGNLQGVYGNQIYYTSLGAEYLKTYTSPISFYLKSYTNELVFTTYLGPDPTQSYTAAESYTAFPSTYLGENFGSYTGKLYYASPNLLYQAEQTGNYDSLLFQTDYASGNILNYTGAYQNNYLDQYTGFFAGLYSTLYNVDYIGDYNISYTADYQTDYTGDYTAEYSTTFDAIYQQDYLGNFAGDFAGETIDATSTTNETYTLYVRIA